MPVLGVLNSIREVLNAVFDVLSVARAVFFSNPMMLFGS